MNVPGPRSDTRGSRWRTLRLLVGVAVAYYVGSVIGLSLRPPGTTPSILWPPNALLTAVMLATPPRLWPLCIAASLPTHVMAEVQEGWSYGFTFALFVTNCLEALLAAGGIRYFSDTPGRFDTLRGLSVFLAIGVVAAPLLSSFADAAVVHWMHLEPYWQVWRSRLTSNLLAQLAITPAAVSVIRGLPDWLRHAPQKRKLEAVGLGISIALAVLVPLSGEPPSESVKLLVTRTPLLVALPFLLWAAVRFYTTGASLAFAMTSFGTAWAAVHGQWFAAVPISDSTVLAVQLVLIVLGVTLLIVGAVIAERDQTARDLAENLWLHALLSQLSATFVQMHGARVEGNVETWLGRLGKALDVDIVRVMRVVEESQNPVMLANWHSTIDLPASSNSPENFPWMMAELAAERPVIVEDARLLPDTAAPDRESLIELGMFSTLVLPLVAEHKMLGTLGFGCRPPRPWPQPLVATLRLVADVFANALLRKQTEEALMASEQMKSAIVASLPTGVAVIDRSGTVRAVNEKWTQLMRASEDPAYPPVDVGDNLIETFRSAARHHPRLAEAVTGIAAVMSGTRDRFSFEHAQPSAGDMRWWVMFVAPLRSYDHGGAVVTYAEITERRRAEQDAERSRQELAHVTRVSTMGALAVSLAHQLNQPLAAIRANAQAGIRLLDDSKAELRDLREILADVVDDDRRASDVIQRLRDLLKNGQAAYDRLDLRASIQDIAVLVQSDAVIRNVTVTLDFTRGAPTYVRGDRVQLQQVMLNLLVNALEASDVTSGGGGRVDVGVTRRHDGVAEVIIRDSGKGLDPALEELVFEPFYTTKPGGMGMGLSIARSIVEAHGGRIRISNGSPQGGAIAVFTLPLDRVEAT